MNDLWLNLQYFTLNKTNILLISVMANCQLNKILFNLDLKSTPTATTSDTAATPTTMQYTVQIYV